MRPCCSSQTAPAAGTTCGAAKLFNASHWPKLCSELFINTGNRRPKRIWLVCESATNGCTSVLWGLKILELVWKLMWEILNTFGAVQSSNRSTICIALNQLPYWFTTWAGTQFTTRLLTLKTVTGWLGLGFTQTGHNFHITVQRKTKRNVCTAMSSTAVMRANSCWESSQWWTGKLGWLVLAELEASALTYWVLMGTMWTLLRTHLTCWKTSNSNRTMTSRTTIMQIILCLFLLTLNLIWIWTCITRMSSIVSAASTQVRCLSSRLMNSSIALICTDSL